MGAGQSSDDTRNAPQRPAVVKTSYYELLEIDRQATDDEIKKAYRRKALELHPDRNYGNVESTTSLFSEIQSAYEVLSDPQERAWYDSHEDAILRDVDPAKGSNREGYEYNVGLTTADDITRMFSRFHGGVEYSDAPGGFFGFLRETFEKLALEEDKAARLDGVDALDYPSFGHKDDAHEDVVKAFYAVWTGFSTKKSFSWRDQYSTRGVADRRTRRAIEKENKRFRDDGVHEFNGAVRSLVAFVRKRDPRYKPNTQSEAERQNALREAAAAQAARQRAANAAKMDKDVLPDWAKARDPEELEESEEEESDEEHFECIVCRKVFKSENQFEAHEKSKKHLKSVQALRRKLRKEGVELDLDDETEGESTPREQEDEDVQDDVHTNGVDPVSNDQHEISESVQNMDLNGSSTKPELNDHPKQAEDKSEQHDAPDLIETHPDEEGEDLAQSEEGENLAQSEEEEQDQQPSSQETSSIDQTSPPAPESQPKLGKAAQKRAKKAAQTATSAADQSQNRCASCNATFPSKSRLFQHIRDLKHAAPVPIGKAKGKMR